ALGLLVFLTLGCWLNVRLIRRFRPIVQTWAIRWLESADNAAELPRWFALLQGVLVALVWLLALDAASRVLGLGVSSVLGLVTFSLAILGGARLVTLACRILSVPLVEYGERHLGQGHFRYYWERVARLVPFSLRCFEIAVYVLAASRCFRELDFFAALSSLVPKYVHCIVILLPTRLLI